MKKTIYKITVNNWDKYNGTLKKGHKKIMISTGFLEDAKIRTLPSGGKLLYLGLLLRCGEVTSSSIEASHDLLVSFAGGSGQVVSRLLSQLEALQLVSVERNNILYELNRKEEKIKEEKRSSTRVSKPKVDEPENNPDLNKIVWASYREAYLKRWKQEPLRDAKANSAVSNIVKRVGADAAEILSFYVSHNDTFYVKATHSIGLAFRDIETLRTQWLNKHAITNSDMKKI